MVFNIILFVILISLSAFFSLSETAIFSLSNLKLHRLQEHYMQGKMVRRLLQRPTRMLSTINFGNMLVNIGVSSLFTTFFVSLIGDEGLIVAIFVSGICILFLGEVFPKTFAIYMAEPLSLACAPLLSFFSKLFLPFVYLIEKIVALISSMLIRQPKKVSFTFEELKTAFLLSRHDGQISAGEEKLGMSVLEFKDTWVSQILNPRIDIYGVDSKLSQEEVLRILREKKHSKFPIYEGSLDNITGILYAKDIFVNPHTDYHTLLHVPLFIPESKKIDEALKLFLEKNERIAIVVDEYGGTQGLVTFEDIVEEIFGEIYDEFETPREAIEKIDEVTYRFGGRVPVKKINLDLRLQLPEEQDTVAGFLLSRMDKIPHPQDIFYFNNLEFLIERSSAKRIISVILKIKR
ncbi:MAG: hemolysin family protein [Candidatus Omnitrophota bacterium]